MADEEKKKNPAKTTKPKQTKTEKPKPKTTKKTSAKKTTPKKETTTKKTTAKTKEVKKEKPKEETKAKPKEEKTEKKTEVKKQETKEKKESKKDEEKYKVKIKPKLSKEKQEQIKIRKQIKKRTPEFLREEWFRYKRIPRNWRRPDGITSKMRINLKYRPSRVRVGFRGPRDVRELHSSGFEEVMIYNVNDLKQINKETQAGRIGSTVGTRKRMEIEKKAEELNVRILNI